MMNGRGKSDSAVVPAKPPNKVGRPAAEVVEGRALAKGNVIERNTLRTPRRGSVPSALDRVRQAARKERKQRFTALLHHVYDVERLRSAYLALERRASAGIDGETRQHTATAGRTGRAAGSRSARTSLAAPASSIEGVLWECGACGTSMRRARRGACIQTCGSTPQA